jgi:inorganic pyrophosphatase
MDVSKIEPGDEKEANVFIVSEKGSKNFYEYDKQKELFVLKKILKSPFPGCYGYIPKTHHNDANLLDVIIVSSEPMEKGIVTKCRPIGLIRFRAEIPDDVLIAISIADNELKNVKNLSELDDQIKNNINTFLEEFKELKIENIFDSERAKKAINHAIELYKREFD